MTNPKPIGVAITGEDIKVNRATLDTSAKSNAIARKHQNPKVNRIPIRPNFLFPATT
jgi:hypothetical protein